MVRPSANDDVFRAIADPTRRGILDILADGEQPVMALAESFDLTLPAISQHLKILKEAGLVAQEQIGRQRFYEINPEPLREVADWMSHYERFWKRKLKSLGDNLEKHK